ncbi:nitrate- and nitrite sensing domain-containing protein [Streptomyces phaeochromogenes]|uniref:histidine kinase n=1 Tax=Streptomyces phaeochromogenes TaxID=1923 RepID=A0ABZ1H7G5_STRPH|nr:nitrate- and nitrite sensing domain-containing protein [Streptomyces phaeochromogenes]WSD14105.1 nitrate- and nitrite sensing domain-containing protein [Streptomyces phaeochromogenes]WSJ08955.1 nitrate- and nitrite sensing domain-containing protein [Streptomyces phaeochromogenes]
MSPRTGSRRRLGSIRLSLILLALVPSVTLAAMWGVTTIQMFSEGLRLRDQTELSKSTGAMGTDATLALQRERSLSAVLLASPGSSRTALDEQRARTDKAVATLVGQSDAIQRAPERISDRMYSVIASVGSLEYYRGQVDNPTDITPEQALDQYTSIIDDQIHAFQELSQVDDGELTSQAGPLVALEHSAELVSQEDAQLHLAWPSGKLDENAWNHYVQLVNTKRWLVEDQLVPSLRGSVKAQTERILQGPEWKALEGVEDQVVAARAKGLTDGRKITLPDAQKRWSPAFDKLGDQYTALIRQETTALLERSDDRAEDLLIKAAALSTGGFVALLVCVLMSWRITRSLSRRLRGLRIATLSLAEERLPDVVARLNRGEKVDVESATPPLDYGRDELGQVAQAFNAAQRTAVHTAVELADTRRGFQKVILGIARQSQNLVNLQLTKLDALERQHQDPEILKGLYELDSTASQLRRYEENLVIISGEQPRRSWTEPVALIDILRSAVGEVAEYQRVEVNTDEEVFLTPPAVADVIHLLAELIDNATAYSPAPSPVGVRAGMVAKGLAVEIEDRGLGMSDEDYASFNAQLTTTPQFDVVALADDLRLGMFVVARLATRHGIAVTLRSSPYGGTTAIVLIPHEIVVREPFEFEPPSADAENVNGALPAAREQGGEQAGGPVAEPVGVAAKSSADRIPGTDRQTHERSREAQPVARARTPQAAETRVAAGAARSGSAAAGHGGLTPLPRRVPQTSLAAELREDVPPVASAEADDSLADFTAERAASSLSGFQRGTLQARDNDTDTAYDQGEETAPEGASVTSTPPADRS